eukprot:3753812-Rhodomonas_salina.3
MPLVARLLLLIAMGMLSVRRLGLRSMLVDGPEKHAGEAACCLQNLAVHSQKLLCFCFCSRLCVDAWKLLLMVSHGQVTTVEKKLMIAETPGLLLGLINLMIRCKPQSQSVLTLLRIASSCGSANFHLGQLLLRFARGFGWKGRLLGAEDREE